MRVVISSAILFAFTVSTASAQTLAAVAKKEEERRKVVKAGKVYTNGDLKSDPGAPPPPSNASPSGPSSTPAPGAQAPSEKPAAGKDEAEGQVKDEAYWRGRIGAARSALERSRIFADALKSRINALTTDFVNRDDPAQRAQLELERKRAMAELDRVNTEITDQTKAITEIEEDARKAGVPPGWLR